MADEQEDPEVQLETSQQSKPNPTPAPTTFDAELKYETDWHRKQIGRPTEYRPIYNEYAARMVALGATMGDLAVLFNVSRECIYEWRSIYPKFSDAILLMRSEADRTVEQSLFKRATGFMRVIEKVTNAGEVVQTREEVPPDTGSMIFWLKNRQPHKWSDKRELELSGSVALTATIMEKEPTAIDVTPSDVQNAQPNLTSPEVENYSPNRLDGVQIAQPLALSPPPEPVKTIGINLEDCKVPVREEVRMVPGDHPLLATAPEKSSAQAKRPSKTKKSSRNSKSSEKK